MNTLVIEERICEVRLGGCPSMAGKWASYYARSCCVPQEKENIAQELRGGSHSHHHAKKSGRVTPLASSCSRQKRGVGMDGRGLLCPSKGTLALTSPNAEVRGSFSPWWDQALHSGPAKASCF